jgi:hypothetical protein
LGISVRQRTDHPARPNYDHFSFFRFQFWEILMSLGLIALIVLVLVLLGVLPTWGHSRSWGYGPSGVVGLIVVVLVVMLLMGQL